MRSARKSGLKCLLATAACLATWAGNARAAAAPERREPERPLSANTICDNSRSNSPAVMALRFLCQSTPAGTQSHLATAPLIVVGFVGGFVKPDDLRHPEPLFASYLRQHYGSELQAKVFSNHDARGAQSFVLNLLDTNHDGVVSPQEKKDARIIIYGHSWGASEAAAFARRLGRLQIPVLLTIQLDIIRKPGQKPGVIPANVERAINFYQPAGPLHGLPAIVAADPAKTVILGDVRMVYGRSHIDCNNYNWFVRTFNRPHHELENDARVWQSVTSLIDQEVSLVSSTGSALSPVVGRAAQDASTFVAGRESPTGGNAIDPPEAARP